MAKTQETQTLAICKGCKKEINLKSLLKHIGRAKSCKIKYGQEFNTMKAKARKQTYSNYNKENADKINAKKRIIDKEKAKKKRTMLEELIDQTKKSKDPEKLGFDYKFTIFFDEIELQNINPEGCIVKFGYPLFSSYLSSSLEITFVTDEPKMNTPEKIRETSQTFQQRRGKEEIKDTLDKLPIGKSNFSSKILPLDNNHLKFSSFSVFFYPSDTFLIGT